MSDVNFFDTRINKGRNKVRKETLWFGILNLKEDAEYCTLANFYMILSVGSTITG
jgi:hypothetical protein